MSITLMQLFKDLTYGELAQLSVGNLIPSDLESEPDPKDYDRILTHINLGMKELYKRFFLLSREIYIQQYEEIEVYELHSRFNQTNVASLEPIKYILDTPQNPFLDDVLKIEEVYDEGGNKLPMNDITEELSIYTPSFRSVQYPYPKNENIFAVQYRASAPRIEYVRGMNPEEIELDLPNSLHEALIYYIAHRVHAGMGQGIRDNNQESGAYYQKFEASCKIVELHGLEVQGEPGDWRFDRHGWV